MDLARARFLISPDGRAALASLDPGLSRAAPHLLIAHLRKTHPTGNASALAEQVTLRAKARERFGEDHGLVFSHHGLEMMTHPAVAERRARRIAADGGPVVDLTCGIGGDLRAIAATGVSTVGVERDPVAALLASANVPHAEIVLGDATRPLVRLERCAALIDPSRRAGIARRFDPESFSPSWTMAVALASSASLGVIKGPPGLDLVHAPGEAEVEFVQLGKSLRECALWFGEGARQGLRRAVLLPEDVCLTSDAPEAPSETVSPGAVIIDPESCVTRAGLVRHLAYTLGARMMDRQVAYLSAESSAPHPMADTFEVLDVIPFSVSRLKTRLRQSGWRPDQIRRRAFPVEPDELRRLLGRMEGEPVTLICTTLSGQRTIFVTREIPAPHQLK